VLSKRFNETRLSLSRKPRRKIAILLPVRTAIFPEGDFKTQRVITTIEGDYKLQRVITK